MSPVIVISAWILGGVGILSGVYWIVVQFRMRRIAGYTPTLEEGLSLDPVRDLVSVIVPAHDEERVIQRLVEGVLGQDGVDFELIVVLDRCRDRTLQRLRAAAGDDARVRIVEIEDCPDDWAGKCHAAAAGAAVARGDWLLFTDADVGFEPGVLRAATSFAETNGVDLLSAWSSLTAVRWWEIVIQPAAVITLLRIYPPDRVNNDARPRSFANGQFMLFRASSYRDIGGHESVKDRLLEDLAFAELVHRHEGRIRVVTAGDMVKTSMYESLDDLLRGWKRILMESSKRNISRIATNLVLLLGSGLAPIACWGAIAVGILMYTDGEASLLGGASIAAGIFGILSQGLSLGRIFHHARMPVIGVLGWTVGCLLVASTLAGAIFDLVTGRPTRWGGREYVLRPGPR